MLKQKQQEPEQTPSQGYDRCLHTRKVRRDHQPSDGRIKYKRFLRGSGLSRVKPRAKPRVPVDRQILEHAIAEMRRIGNNINHIAHASNLNQPTDSDYLYHVL